ncbi:glycosyltransferase family 4 protein [Ilumatobacter nonamiensis]|uniref:glycosyltransferase family 4 protein n=1 Tax=Ilumatobacter nonamiensis TaxID=467093 RepID=UPI00034DC529|nr:glycosyltransferase family 4 protein [Ilumatobacter nonamiensis]
MTMLSDHLDASRPGLPRAESEGPPSNPTRRLVIVVRADPVICGHSGEARNLAEAALTRGFDDVRIVTWPITALLAAGLPLKPLESVLPYSAGITVERPEPVGDYKVPDGRHLGGIVGRLVELFTEGVPTTAMSLYLTPHDTAVSHAAHIARSTGMCAPLTTIAEAVGSDITNVVRTALDQGRFGAAAQVLSTYLSNDVCVAVSEFTKELIVSAANEVDERWGTAFGPACSERVQISYPAVDSSSYTSLDAAETAARLAARGLERDRYVMFLSRVTKAKGVDDLINGFAISAASHRTKLAICGTGPEASAMRALAASTPVADRILFFDDVDDAEKPHLMAGSAAYVLPSKPRPEFVETFGIALVEKMLAGGGPIVTCDTGGIGEAVGSHATFVPPSYPSGIANALNEIVLGLSPGERIRWGGHARSYAMQFDRQSVFDRLFSRVAETEAAATAA